MLPLTGLLFAVLPSEKFASYKLFHDKVYSSTTEEAHALNAFSANDDLINSHNSQPGRSYSLGHNEYSDLSFTDFTASFLNSYSPLNLTATSPMTAETFPPEDSIDWTTRGAVTAIKNQGRSCGSCWAFAAVGATEGAYAIAAGGHLVSLSEQQLLACDFAGHGCKGGDSGQAFDWVEHGNPLCTESDWPYTSGTGHMSECTSTCHPAVAVDSWARLPSEDEGSLVAALRKGPVAVAIEADLSTFQLYKGGIYDDPSCLTKVNHAVLLVGFGYDETSQKHYYKVKNSWGRTWGEDGFMRIQMGTNRCGLAIEPTHPTRVSDATGRAFPRPPLPPQPPPPPPAMPPPGASSLLTASTAALFSSALALIATLIAVCSCLCCGRSASMLLFVAIGSAPANFARFISGLGVLHELDPQLSLVRVFRWADCWQCHLGEPGEPAHARQNARNCALLAFMHVMSSSAALWASAIALHIIFRATCGAGMHPPKWFRWSACFGVPLLTCGVLALDRACDAHNLPHMPPWFTSACNYTDSPHFSSWDDLADGVFSSGATAREGDSYPLILLAAPRALAFVLCIVGLFAAACGINRLQEQHEQLRSIEGPTRRFLEPATSSACFLGLSCVVWILPLAHAAVSRWYTDEGTGEAAPWLAFTSDLLFPLIGTLAAICWYCGSRKKRRLQLANVSVRRHVDEYAGGINRATEGTSWRESFFQEGTGAGRGGESLQPGQRFLLVPERGPVAVGVPVNEAIVGTNVPTVEGQPQQQRPPPAHPLAAEDSDDEGYVGH